MKFREVLCELFTDAKGRPEPKNIIGIPATAIGILIGLARLCGAFAFSFTDWLAFMGFSVGLITITAVADSRIDAGPPSPPAGA